MTLGFLGCVVVLVFFPLQWNDLLSLSLSEADFNCVLSVVEDVVKLVCLYGQVIDTGKGNYKPAAKWLPSGMVSEAEVRWE